MYAAVEFLIWHLKWLNPNPLTRTDAGGVVQTIMKFAWICVHHSMQFQVLGCWKISWLQKQPEWIGGGVEWSTEEEAAAAYHKHTDISFMLR